MSKAFTTDRTVRRYEALVTGKRRRWTKAEIHGLTKLLNASRWATPADSELVARVYRLANCDLENPSPVTIEREHSDAGLAWLRRQAWRSDGVTPRLVGGEPTLGAFERKVLADFSHFTFDGWGTEAHYEIVWRVHSKSGGSFAYVQRHWQKPYVVG